MKNNKKLIQTKFLVSFIFFGFLSFAFSAAQTQKMIIPFKDNTLIEKNDGSLSNGMGMFMHAGRTGQTSNSVRRAVLQFQFADSIPADAVIDSVSLVLKLNNASSSREDDIRLHRVLQDWGEGTSVAPQGGGQGGPAATNDATWIHTMYDTRFWNNPGGDFTPTASASTKVGSDTIDYVWTDTAMVNDLNFWLARPDSNFGWILIGNEDSSASGKKFYTKDNSNMTFVPRLFITYTSSASVENELSGVDVKVFPNPASDLIHVKWESQSLTRPQLRLTNQIGQTVWDQASVQLVQNGEVEINVAHLPSGMYFLSMIVDGRSLMRNVVVD